jgi:large subunit ribosomal protein L4
MKLKVLNIQGQETGKEVELPASVFEIDPNDHAIYLDVKQYLANQRQGTHKSKDKSEVNYSTRKIKRQKGTGTARAGSLKSGVFVGGGRMHGPRPRNYGFKLNKKLKRLARASALTYKAKDNQVFVIDALSMAAPKTKDFTAILGNLNVAENRTLWVLPEQDKNVYLSVRNIPSAEVTLASDLNTYQILKAGKVIFVADAINKLTETLN